MIFLFLYFTFFSSRANSRVHLIVQFLLSSVGILSGNNCTINSTMKRCDFVDPHNLMYSAVCPSKVMINSCYFTAQRN
jgi:hypothetical protein